MSLHGKTVTAVVIEMTSASVTRWKDSKDQQCENGNTEDVEKWMRNVIPINDWKEIMEGKLTVKGKLRSTTKIEKATIGKTEWDWENSSRDTEWRLSISNLNLVVGADHLWKMSVMKQQIGWTPRDEDWMPSDYSELDFKGKISRKWKWRRV